MAKRPTIVGVGACLAVLRARPDAIRRAWITEAAKPQVRELTRALARRRRPYRIVSGAEIEKLSGAMHHEGVCVEAPPPPAPAEEDFARELTAAAGPACAVYLDGVQNPHNLGALLRTCAHFGVRGVLGAAGQVPRLGPAAMRIAEGGAEYVPVIRCARPALRLGELRDAGVSIVAASGDAPQTLYETDLSARAVFVLGSERQGVTPALTTCASATASIPGTGRVDSLNVGVACAVLLGEHARRHGL